MVGVLEIFLVRTHGRVPEDGVLSRPGSHSQEGSGGGVSRTTFFGGPVILPRGLFFWFIGVFLRDHRFLQVPVLSSADFLNWYSIFLSP